MIDSIQFLIVDDNLQISESLADRIKASYPKSEFFFATTVREAIEQVDTGRRFDVIFLDLILPDKNGTALLHHLSTYYSSPLPSTIVVSGMTEEDLIERCRTLGARGFLPKARAVDFIEKSIAEVLRGNEFFVTDETPSRASSSTGRSISQREFEVARLVAQGKSNLQIAEELSMPAGTVKNVILSLLRIYEVGNRGDLISRFTSENAG